MALLDVSAHHVPKFLKIVVDQIPVEVPTDHEDQNDSRSIEVDTLSIILSFRQ